ncbi:RDD family protein [Phytoactinopolyspora mesophila]|uniref:RDD family protein n=1 Tax=Phytoactinopolyspora mesophila TaxID=2650750 RepID=UPI0013910314
MLDPRKALPRRIAAFVIDVIPGFVLFWSLVIALGTEIGQRSGTNITMRFEVVNGQVTAELFGTLYHLEGGEATLVSLIGLAYWVLVLVVWQGLTGRTIGKSVMAIRTVNAAGRPCGIGRAAVRWIFLAVDAFPFIIPMLVGFITAAASQDRQRVGDRVAKTWVVHADAVGQPVPGTVPAGQPAPGAGWQPQFGAPPPPEPPPAPPAGAQTPPPAPPTGGQTLPPAPPAQPGSPERPPGAV